ncbi:hypothetical protein HG264_10030 [Pseudomonas sp. gcc21]|uniref:hypothetical protein n=1 Tax=Pseudomonas sp. gcc21 TaxID=2726989 RepID=UPI00145243A3|nr:hypothetical protein [Pseudomonas sp. gcc21]QJD59219.1 hypothetical protein HG264_10030 [Pseudomonas sp. gcc21]
MKYLIMLPLLVLVGCAAAPEAPVPEAVFSDPPHLWSGQKMIDHSPEVCARKGVEILESLLFVGVVKNGSYVYGTLLTNRAAIKCIANGPTTFVYAAVAGPDVKQVERLRNEIVWRL